MPEAIPLVIGYTASFVIGGTEGAILGSAFGGVLELADPDAEPAA